MRILLVEDDERLALALSDTLRMHGMVVTHARNAALALELLTAEMDVVILDLSLPDRDGFEVCSRIRRNHHDVPILMATARGDLASRVHGLNLGADDYLLKPYDVRELMARLHAIVRRRGAAASGPAPGAGPVVVRCGDVTIDVGRRCVEREGTRIALTRKEFDLLALMARMPGVVFRRDQILSEVWQTNWKGNQRTLEVHVAAIRSKTGRAGIIETVRGVGYRLGI